MLLDVWLSGLGFCLPCIQRHVLCCYTWVSVHTEARAVRVVKHAARASTCEDDPLALMQWGVPLTPPATFLPATAWSMDLAPRLYPSRLGDWCGSGTGCLARPLAYLRSGDLPCGLGTCVICYIIFPNGLPLFRA